MASRQLPECRHEHSLFNVVEGEAGESESVRPLAQGRCGVDVSAEIQAIASIDWLFRFMAQPETTNSAGWVLGQSPQLNTAVMVAADQHHLRLQPLVKVPEISPQSIRESEPAVDQISEDDDALRSPSLTESLKSQQRGSVVVTGQWNSACLEDLSLSQVKVGNEQFFAGWSPDGFLCKQDQFFIPPLPAAMRVVRSITASPDVDGSQQSAGPLRYAPFCFQKMEVFQMRIPRFIGRWEWSLRIGGGNLRMSLSIDF